MTLQNSIKYSKSVKKVFFVFLQFPVAVVRSVLAAFSLLITWVDFKMITVENWLILHGHSSQGSAQSEKEGRDVEEGLISLEEVMEQLRRFSRPDILKTRMKLEKKEAGQRAMARCTDRRLYAVLKPTKEEDLQRIENAFNEMSLGEWRGVQERIKDYHKDAL